jgi:DNA-binding beta-propeller fold protein YncE
VALIHPDVRVVPISSGGTNGLDIDANNGLVYAVTNSTVSGWCKQPVGTRLDRLSIVDPVSGKEMIAVSTGRGPVWPLVDSTQGLVYVATSDGIVAVHEAGTGNRIASIQVGGLPHDLGLDPVSGLLVVSNTNDGSQKYIALVDTSTREVRAQVEVDSLPHRIMMDRERRVAYVISVESGTITTVDTANAQVLGATASGGRGTLWFSPALQRLYVPNRDGASPETIRVLSAETKALVGKIGPFLQNAGHQAFSIAVDDKKGMLYAALGDSDLVGVADAQSLRPLAVFSAVDCTWAVKLDEARRMGYVTGVTGGAVAAFSLDEVAAAVGR